MIGLLRPPKATGNRKASRKRLGWKILHVTVAATAISLGIFASVTGVQKAEPHGVQGAWVYELSLYGWLLLLLVAMVSFEVCRRRLQSKRNMEVQVNDVARWSPNVGSTTSEHGSNAPHA